MQCAQYPELSKLHAQITKGWLRAKKNVTPEIAPYHQIRDEFAKDDFIMQKKTYHCTCCPTPPDHQTGRQRTPWYCAHQTCLRELYRWCINSGVHKIITSCFVCQNSDKNCPNLFRSVTTIQTAIEWPFQKYAIDIVCPYGHMMSLYHYFSTLLARSMLYNRECNIMPVHSICTRRESYGSSQW